MRYQSIDVARGVAIVLMVIFHFCFDLTTFGLSTQDFYTDLFWLHSRTFIVSLFLLLVGISFSISSQNGIPIRRYLIRQRNLFICLVFVSLSTYLVSQDRFIFFGILHFIFIASILNLIFHRHYYLNLVIGCLFIIGNNYTNLIFHTPWLKWVGFQAFKPETDDFAPLFPWYGVVLLGLFLGKLIYVNHQYSKNLDTKIGRFQGVQLLGFFGRHSLIIYMVHQPILIGLLYSYTRII